MTAEELAEREAAAEFTARTRKRDIVRRIVSRSNLWLQGKLFGAPEDAAPDARDKRD